ncbi:MFS transporter [Haloglycomyces albus]|uniref:MFS transporter n=1 Tax=Haloglycomyces albus TaxID=526067 RepID=UPI00046CFBFF|nr:MFS transporter [Haloglycomyces albus]
MSFENNSEDFALREVLFLALTACVGGAALFTVDFILVLQLQSSGFGGAAVALLITCGTVPVVALTPIAGRIADRFDSRWIMSLSGLAQSVFILAMTQTNGYVAHLVLLSLCACGTAVMAPTVSALVPRMASGRKLPIAISFVQTGNLLGMVIGPAAAGFLVAAYDTDVALTIVAAAALGRALFSLTIRTRRGGAANLVTDDAATESRTWTLRSDRLILTTVIGLGGCLMVLSAANVLEVFLVREVYGAGEATYGIINSSWTFGMTIGALIVGWTISRFTRDMTLSWSVMFSVGAMCAIILVIAQPLPSVNLIIPLYFLGGIMNAGINAGVQTIVARRVPEAHRGRAGARINGTVQGASLVGFGFGALLSTMFSVETALMIAAGGGLAVAIGCVPCINRTARTSPEPAVDGETDTVPAEKETTETEKEPPLAKA